MEILDIADVARRSGIPASTLRFYEELGLIASIGRRGLRRIYAPDVLLQLGLIALGRSAGFSLEEIKGMFGPDGQPALSRAQWQAKAEELDAHIRQLVKLRDVIHHVADCPAPRHLECEQFQQLISAAIASRRQDTGPISVTASSSRAGMRKPRNRSK
ncbi:helix-turn-helix domain-containing protein [Pannonibacter sp. SL95]|uniref:helix-turn-helix domain-containing protein n=1 Tax=Pannonibacter sp. SL95 TaxID=2995153 RepID=UPI0022762B09|nr:helix-turn-helix domain-containing protein [Pannonibacter sp. SL95]MCY1704995.1 helix-turn-helix domain-containing protein [Pannonibacter sp. SL95]